MGQMRFRDPKTGKTKFVADDKGDIYAIGKDGKVSDRISQTSGSDETVEVIKEDFGGERASSTPKIILPGQN